MFLNVDWAITLLYLLHCRLIVSNMRQYTVCLINYYIIMYWATEQEDGTVKTKNLIAIT